MGITYDPKDAGGTWPMNVYRANIESAEETTAKSSGRPMIKMGFKLYDRERGTKIIYEHMVIPSALWKLQKVAEAIGKQDAFESGAFDRRDYVGANLEVEIDTEKQDGYADKNVILEFMPIRPSAPAKSETGTYEDYATSMPKDSGEDPPF